jgi:hypothetical protein
MYYDASGTDYISTPSFAIPNTGILTVEAWMKSKDNISLHQAIIGDTGSNPETGYILVRRDSNSYNIRYRYYDGSESLYIILTNFFQSLDNQWIHIVTVCDYVNKTLKVYRNGIQFGITENLTGVPVFPLGNKIRYIGSYDPSQYNIYDGSLDEVRIYNRGLSAEEVAAIYNQTKGRY